MLSDICAACGDGLVYVGYLDRWMSASEVVRPGECPENGGDHEPSISVG